MDKSTGLIYLGASHLADLQRAANSRVNDWQKNWCLSESFVNASVAAANFIVDASDVDGCDYAELMGVRAHVYWHDHGMDWCKLVLNLGHDQVPLDDVRNAVLAEARKHLLATILDVDWSSIKERRVSSLAIPHCGLWSKIKLHFGDESIDILVPNALLSVGIITAKPLANRTALVQRKACVDQTMCELEVKLPAGEIELNELRELKVGDILNIDRDLDLGVDLAIGNRVLATGTPCRKTGKLAVVLD